MILDAEIKQSKGVTPGGLCLKQLRQMRVFFQSSKLLAGSVQRPVEAQRATREQRARD